MKGKKCDRDAMKALQSHYNGTAEGERRKAIARADFDSLFYNNKTTFPLEKYTIKIKECHEIYEKYGIPMHEEDKLHHFLDKINNPNSELKTEVKICRAHHFATFEDAPVSFQAPSLHPGDIRNAHSDKSVKSDVVAEVEEDEAGIAVMAGVVAGKRSTKMESILPTRLDGTLRRKWIRYLLLLESISWNTRTDLRQLKLVSGRKGIVLRHQYQSYWH